MAQQQPGVGQRGGELADALRAVEDRGVMHASAGELREQLPDRFVLPEDVVHEGMITPPEVRPKVLARVQHKIRMTKPE